MRIAKQKRTGYDKNNQKKKKDVFATKTAVMRWGGCGGYVFFLSPNFRSVTKCSGSHTYRTEALRGKEGRVWSK